MRRACVTCGAGLLLLGVAFAAQAADSLEVTGRRLREPPSIHAQMQLSWAAPFGEAGARRNIVASCDDTTRADTLYLSYIPEESSAAPIAMEAVIYFQPAAGDTLGPFWHFKRGWPNNGNLLIEFDRLIGFPCDVPWPQRLGSGRVSYDHRSGRGRLDLAFVVEPSGGSGVAAHGRYCLGRVIIRQRRTDLEGCLQPVVVELESLRLHPRFGADLVVTHGPDRFVTWNARSGQMIRAHWREDYARPWRPDVPIGHTPATLNAPAPETGSAQR